VPMDDGAGHRDKSVGHESEFPPLRDDSNLKEGGYDKVIPATGHLSPLESPIEVAEIAGYFLEKTVGQDDL
jgi:hypothetical protein